jgi:glycosyltransferase involved in cell wall biosynthesis
MPHVALICEYPTLNGGERSLLSVLPGLAIRGFRFTAIAPAEGPLARAFAKQGIEVVPFAATDAAGRRLSQDVLRTALAKQLRGTKPDLVHANSLAMGRLVGPVAVEAGLPSIAHLRDIVGLSRQAVGDLNANRRLLAVSHATRDFHIAQGIAADKTHVLYNGVDLTRFRPREPTGWLHRELGLPPDAILVGSIGQLVLRKGQDVLARAAAMLAERFPQVHYVFVGERFSQKAEAVAFEGDLRRSFESSALAGKGHFLGVRADVPEILPELSLLVHAARQEPLGRVLLEAAAAGVATIATDVGGTREIFPPEAQAARLVPPDDPAALAAAMAEMLDDDPRRRRMGAAALKRATDAFDLETAAAALAGHYRAAIKGI